MFEQQMLTLNLGTCVYMEPTKWLAAYLFSRETNLRFVGQDSAWTILVQLPMVTFENGSEPRVVPTPHTNGYE